MGRARVVRRPVAGAAVVAALLALAAPRAGDAAQGRDPRAERERVRSEQATVAAEVDALEADSAEVEAALAAIGANVADQRSMLDDARRAADQAAASLELARTQERQAVEQVASLQQQVRAVAIEAYMRPITADPTVILSAGSVGEAAQRQALLGFRTDRDAELLDELRAAREDVALRRQEAEAATARAEQERAELAGRVEELEVAEAQQEEFAASVDERLDAALGEAASLAALDKQLADQIAAEQARIAAELARSRPRASSSRAAVPPITVANGSIVSVRGIRVHTQIASQLEDLLDAADADGVRLGGGGYRDPSSQVALRRAHCGSSDFDVYQASASSCSPPTARPGSSMHERGLAVDFTYNGSLISSRSNPGYRWLDANAGGFGFFNLPAEPWHWSVNGK